MFFFQWKNSFLFKKEQEQGQTLEMVLISVKDFNGSFEKEKTSIAVLIFNHLTLLRGPGCSIGSPHLESGVSQYCLNTGYPNSYHFAFFKL